MKLSMGPVLAIGFVMLLSCAHPASRVTTPAVLPDAGYTFVIEPAVIAPGQSATLFWNIPGATQVSIEKTSEDAKLKGKGELNRIGTFDAKGQVEVKPLADTTYVLSCEGSKSITCASVSVRVRVKEP